MESQCNTSKKKNRCVRKLKKKKMIYFEISNKQRF